MILRRLVLIFAVIFGMSSSAHAQTDEWCYTFDFRVSNYGAYTVLYGEWIYGSGLSVNDELEYLFDAGFTVTPTRFVVAFVSDTETTINNYGSSVFGTDYFLSPIIGAGGRTTLEIEATTAYSTLYFFLGFTGVSAFVESVTVYGDGETPFDRNDCASSSDPAYVYSDFDGQTTRFDYVATAGDVQLSNLLLWLFFSLWGMWLFDKLTQWRRR